MTDVLLVHPEGNFRGNPTMDALLRELADAGLSTAIVAGEVSRLDQSPPAPGIDVLLIGGWRRQLLWRMLGRVPRWAASLFLRLFFPLPRAHAQVGVDQSGIVLSDAWRCSTTGVRGYISFEIFFRDESPRRIKDAEVRACKGLDFAVAQDAVRADLLARENDIPRERILIVPVAPRGRPPDVDHGYIRDRFGIGGDAYVAVVVGSVATWSGSELLVECANRLPDDWVLVLHDRHGFSDTSIEELPERVHLSTRPVPGIEGLTRLLVDADVGIAFYTPTYDNPYVGDNLRHVGLASGKVGMYLQHGIPVIVNDQELLGRVVERAGVGVQIDGPDDFAQALDEISADLDGYRERCQAFFWDHLEASSTLKPVVRRLAAAARRDR